MTTIRDVAKRANVSVNTVSRVLNSRGYLSEETIRKVHQAIDELDYHPSAIARALVKRQTKLIGVIVPSIVNPFFATFLDSLERHAASANYRLVVCNSLQDKGKEKEYVDSLRSNNVAGIVISTRNDHLGQALGGMPAVTLERIISDDIPTITCDNYQGGELATEHLVGAGCRRLAIISGSLDIDLPANKRVQAFVDVARRHGIDPWIYTCDEATFLASSYADTIARIFSEHPDVDGIFATSDVIGAQVIQYCASHHMDVPQRVKVIGFNDTIPAGFTNPPLSTIRQPIDQMADAALKVLEAEIKGEKACGITVLPVKLVKRSTT